MSGRCRSVKKNTKQFRPNRRPVWRIRPAATMIVDLPVASATAWAL